MSQLDDDEGPAPPDEGWKDTFADMSLLLLTFFILMVSMSTMEIVKFQSVFGSIRDAFGGTPIEAITSGGQSQSDGESTEDFDAIRDLQRIRAEILEAQRLAYNAIQSYISVNALESNMSATFDQGKVILTVPDSVLFDPGSERLRPEAEATLRNLLTIFLDQRETDINIMGYTDNSPIPDGARYTDNWELSALRAVNVLRWFVDAGIPVVRLTATGMGDLNPLYPNDSEENRARNRRVEFSLERRVGMN